MKMKYALLVGDGMADFPFVELGNKTPLEYANTPNMDQVATRGTVGMVSTIPDGFSPGSDVANMSLMGYDPKKYYSGRAPIEAASMGVKLHHDDLAFRCNLVTLLDGKMADYSSGHIETEDSHRLIQELASSIDNEEIRFHPGVSYRHLLVINGMSGEIDCTPPHDITDKSFGAFLPKGPGSDILILLMERAHTILANSLVNRERKLKGKHPATDIWLWGQGQAVLLPAMRELYAIEGGVISAVDLVRGLGILVGLEAPTIDGATGYLGTNYKGKVLAAKEILDKKDFVYVHIEAPDETSHEGSLDKKIQAIEEFDKFVVGEMLQIQEQMENLRILVAPDHATPVTLKTHHPAPIPFTICGPDVAKGAFTSYCEKSAKDQPVMTAVELFEKFIKGTF